MRDKLQAIEIFKLVKHTVDSNCGRISIKGQYADETQNLCISDLIPYFARDIFLAQKDEAQLKVRVKFSVTTGRRCPSIEIILDEVLAEESIRLVQLHVVQILWSYNYISYDSLEDRYKQRFSYVFTRRPAHDLASAA